MPFFPTTLMRTALKMLMRKCAPMTPSKKPKICTLRTRPSLMKRIQSKRGQPGRSPAKTSLSSRILRSLPRAVIHNSHESSRCRRGIQMQTMQPTRRQFLHLRTQSLSLLLYLPRRTKSRKIARKSPSTSLTRARSCRNPRKPLVW